MLLRVIERLSAFGTVHFDILVPRLRDKPREVLKLAKIWNHPRVKWHSGRIGDDALRELYQRAYLLLLPLEHAGTCNALIEALACGLPVVTTDVGGVRDYGGGNVYPVTPNNDDDAMVHLIERYLASQELRDKTAFECRRFAEETLSLPRSLEAHLSAYAALAG